MPESREFWMDLVYHTNFSSAIPERGEKELPTASRLVPGAAGCGVELWRVRSNQGKRRRLSALYAEKERKAERREKEKADDGKVRYERHQTGAMFRRGGGPHVRCGIHQRDLCGDGIRLCRAVPGGAEHPERVREALQGGDRASDVTCPLSDAFGLTKEEKRGCTDEGASPFFCYCPEVSKYFRERRMAFSPACPCGIS